MMIIIIIIVVVMIVGVHVIQSMPRRRMRTIVFATVFGRERFRHCGLCIVTKHRQWLSPVAVHISYVTRHQAAKPTAHSCDTSEI